MTDNRLNQIHELLQTTIDAASYVYKQINDGDLSMAMSVTEDIIIGFVSIEETLLSMKDVLNNYEEMKEQITLVKASLNNIVLSFETNEYQQVASIIHRPLLKQLKALSSLVEESTPK